jgi:uncharacterized protein YkwD
MKIPVLAFCCLLAATAANSPKSFADSSASSMSRDLLAAHNAVRARVCVPPLSWSGQLAKYAQNWADTLAAERKFYHHPNSPFGENLFQIQGANATAREVVESWASESRDYDLKSNLCHGRCGHYTQLVWRNTAKVGCGVGSFPGGQVWVCNYDPPGNIIGQRPY